MNALDMQILMMEFCECEHGELGFGHDDYCPCLAMSLNEMVAAQQLLAPDAGYSAASSGIINASANTTSQTEHKPTQRG